MDESNYMDLARARMERTKELLDDAELLLEKESYASANYRAYYTLKMERQLGRKMGSKVGYVAPKKLHWMSTGIIRT